MKREGLILKMLLYLIFGYFLYQPPSIAQELKPYWHLYSEPQKDSLRKRWSDEQVLEVVDSLKRGGNLPNYVKIYPDSLGGGYDLRGISLKEQDLKNVKFSNTHLEGAIFVKTILTGSDFQEAKLDSTNMEQDSLGGVNFQNANLGRVNLREADLLGANMKKANLTLANLQGANLFGVRFDSTYLWQANLGAAKDIRYILWGDSLHYRYIIGEEIRGNIDTSSYWRKTYLRFAEISYRDLKSLYKKESMEEVANEFNFRENEVKTKRLSMYHPLRYFRYFFLNLTCGYGSKPIRLIWWSLFVMGAFALAFFVQSLIPNCTSGIRLVQKENEKEKLVHLKWRKGQLLWNCIYFSLLSFCTFGYGALQPRQWLQFLRLEPLEFKPIRWARILVGFEAALGIWVFALLVIVFFGRG